ncbi:uncharacterized protein LOC110854691 [Folsomia candida]|uniref:F-box domain-containing protein n=1 Tax=Folsomia candida TaxID=158441 RepID=A0A226DZ74_FOLCA|nr:uncharacterized protein LOC110854691 [Folsomia candida]OXA49496.1 hypothetical protein Fcan01_15690 [Folsomia candida]
MSAVLEAGEPTISSREDAPHEEPFLNPDVIGHICKFLGTSDIKNCRLVSSPWNYGATPILKVRSRITLEFSPGYDDDGHPFGADLGGWDISDVVKKLEFYPGNVRLAIPSTEYNLPPPDFAMFPFDNNFKSICVQYPLGDQFHWQRELFTKFILSSSTTLEQLKSEWLEDEVSLDFPLLGGTVFPKLTKLGVGRYFDSDGAVKRIGRAIAVSFPNLKYLKANCDYLVAMSEDGLLPNLSRSLTCLKLGGDLNTNGLECLLKIPASLKKFVLGNGHPLEFEIDDRVDELPTIFYKLLKKHAPTLEHLDLDMSWINEEENHLQWKFPVFPVLKKLCLDYADMLTDVVFEKSGYFGPINYAINFPVLETLYIFCSTKEASRVEAFLPPEMNCQVVPSVKQVDVRIRNYPGVLDQIKIYVRIMALFPNARDHVVSNLQRLLNLA